MWDYVHLPQEANDPAEWEKLIGQFVIEKIQENVPPDTPSLRDRYRLALALFGKLTVGYDVHDTSQLVHLFESEE